MDKAPIVSSILKKEGPLFFGGCSTDLLFVKNPVAVLINICEEFPLLIWVTRPQHLESAMNYWLWFPSSKDPKDPL